MRRNKLEICLHLVWAIWDRVPLLTEDIQRDLYRYLEGICGKDHCEVLAVGGWQTMCICYYCFRLL